MKTTLALVLFQLTVVLVTTNASLVGEKEEWRNPRIDCSADYSPFCTCDESPFSRRILSCAINASEDFTGLRNLLRTNSYTDYNTVAFRMAAALNIPQDVLGGKLTQTLELHYPDKSMPVGEIDPDAFQSTLTYTSRLSFNRCDLTNFGFSILSKFTVLWELGIYSSSLKKINEMPYLPQLSGIVIDGSTSDFESWYTPSLTPNLRAIRITGNPDVDDQKLESILTSMTDNFIYPKLRYLYLNGNKLTRVPPLAFTFPALIDLLLNDNPLEKLTEGSINKIFNDLSYIFLSSSQITTVDPGAFVGDLSSTLIVLSSNYMTNFPEASFRDLLKSMVDHSGYVDVLGNPIVDDCGLAWLLVDNQDLLPYVYGTIANGTRFQDLNAYEYSNCF